MATDNELLRADYNIETPENVTFGYELAGIGSRFIGALIDLLIVGFGLVAIHLLLLLLLDLTGDLARVMLADRFNSGASWLGGVILAGYALVNFILIWGYFVLFELRWNGQTPGKRLAHTRVVAVGGGPAGAVDVVLRNLVRIVDFLPAGYAAGLVVMLCNSQARRLGDYAAGTLVIKVRRDVTLDSLRPAASSVPALDAHLPYPEAQRLALSEYELLRDLLDRRAQAQRWQKLDEAVPRRLARALAARLGVPAPTAAECWQFLEDVAHSYRTKN